jgi:hypothetical protein
MAGGEGAMAHYYVFDLDETLGQMHSFFYQLCTLRPEVYFQNTMPPRHAAVLANNHTAAIRERLGAAYGAFVRAIAEKERSAEPLGLLRPGILEVFRAIQEQKEQGRPVCAMIYSNNGTLFLLELTRDVIHAALGTDDLIRDCIHWFNPMRRPEIVVGQPGSAQKTWAVLRRLLSEGPCGASPDLLPQQVTFFDDRIHPNLKAVLGENSIQVLPYSYKTPCSRVNTLYTEALQGAGFFDTEAETQMLLEYIKKHCATAKAPLTWENHLANIVKLNGRTNAEASSPPPRLADTDMLVAAVKKYDVPAINLGNNPLNVVSSNVFMGGRGRIARRRIITRRRRGTKYAAKKSRHIRRRR